MISPIVFFAKQMCHDWDDHSIMRFASWDTLWQTNSLLLKMVIYFVDFPINSMLTFHGYVSLPEGNPILIIMSISHEYAINKP